MRRRDALVALLLFASLSAFGCRSGTSGEEDSAAADDSPRSGAPEEESPGGGACKAPEAEDERLRQGLDAYLLGQWREAAAPLGAWASDESARDDPAAGRGLYSLGFTLDQLGRAAEASRRYGEALVLLQRDAENEPTLEGLYYLASLHRVRQETSEQLAVVSSALGLLEDGLCPAPDADDDFRHARLAAFAGDDELRWSLLERASEKYANGRGRVVAYHALTEQELARRARESGDASRWERHARRAAELDPGLPGVHRNVGLALLAQDDVSAAAAYWRAHWREEKERGNALVYAIRVLQKVERYREQFGAEHRIENLPEHTRQALEQNSIFEARRMLQLGQELASAESPDPEELEREVAEYRMAQLLTEYAARDLDIQEFALQNGLLPAIHGSGLPRR